MAEQEPILPDIRKRLGDAFVNYAEIHGPVEAIKVLRKEAENLKKKWEGTSRKHEDVDSLDYLLDFLDDYLDEW